MYDILYIKKGKRYKPFEVSLPSLKEGIWYVRLSKGSSIISYHNLEYYSTSKVIDILETVSKIQLIDIISETLLSSRNISMSISDLSKKIVDELLKEMKKRRKE